MSTRRPRSTIDDVARLAGVSVATVSRALRGHPNVAAATRSKVLDAAGELSYAADPRASGLASGRTMTVGVVAPLFRTWYPRRVLAGAYTVLSREGYDLLIGAVDTVHDRHAFLNPAASFTRRVDGLILIDFFLAPEHRDELLALGTNVVTVGERIEPFPSLTIDNRAAARRATNYLLELGHESLGVICGQPLEGLPSPVPSERLAGVRDAYPGLDEALVEYADWTVDSGGAAMRRMLSGREAPTAVFCFSDEMAIGAMRVIRLTGLEVPDDMSILGFDDHELAAAFNLTTVRQRVDALGVRAAEMLLTAIEGDPAEVTSEVWDVDLVCRGTADRPSR